MSLGDSEPDDNEYLVTKKHIKIFLVEILTQLYFFLNYIKLNSVLPFSAPVERLFRTGGLVFVPRRSRLSDRIFENLVITKYNKSYLTL